MAFGCGASPPGKPTTPQVRRVRLTLSSGWMWLSSQPSECGIQFTPSRGASVDLPGRPVFPAVPVAQASVSLCDCMEEDEVEGMFLLFCAQTVALCWLIWEDAQTIPSTLISKMARTPFSQVTFLVEEGRLAAHIPPTVGGCRPWWLWQATVLRSICSPRRSWILRYAHAAR